MREKGPAKVVRSYGWTMVRSTMKEQIAKTKMEKRGIEPPTYRMRSGRSTTELLPLSSIHDEGRSVLDQGKTKGSSVEPSHFSTSSRCSRSLLLVSSFSCPVESVCSFKMPMARVGGVGDAVGPDQWFQTLPIITRYWFGATVVVTLAANFDIIGPQQLYFSWYDIKSHMELWRVATCFLYAGPFSFPTLILCYMLVQFSRQYEAGGPFNTGAGGGTADYAFAIIFAVVAILVSYPLIGPLLGIAPLFCANLAYFVLYIWSKRNPTAPANIWGIPVPAQWLPFAYLALHVCLGNRYMDLLHGIAVRFVQDDTADSLSLAVSHASPRLSRLQIGHLYYFLVDVVPQVQGKDVLQTPQFLIDYFGIGEYRPEPVANPAAQRPQQQQQQQAAGNRGGAGGGGGYHWGGEGRRLGRD